MSIPGTHVFRTTDGFWVFDNTSAAEEWEFFEKLPDTLGLPGDVIPIGPKPDISRPPGRGVYSSAETWEEFIESPDFDEFNDFNCEHAFIVSTKNFEINTVRLHH